MSDIDKLAEALAGGFEPPVAKPCKLGRIIADLPDAAAAELARRVNTWSPEMLAVWMRTHGRPISDTTLYRHRKGYCSCPVTTTESEAA